MPRVYTARAARDYPEKGIKKGETYYWWQFYRQRSKNMSPNRPRRSQLTQREELQIIYDAEDDAAALQWDYANRDDLKESVAEIEQRVSEARDAAQEKYDNLPENFQQAERGQELEQFVSDCESLESELSDIVSELDNCESEEEFEGITEPKDCSWPSC